jgi:hypothetical protein
MKYTMVIVTGTAVNRQPNVSAGNEQVALNVFQPGMPNLETAPRWVPQDEGPPPASRF